MLARCDHRYRTGSGAGQMGTAGYRMLSEPALGEIKKRLL